jgi:hypothetical protein
MNFGLRSEKFVDKKLNRRLWMFTIILFFMTLVLLYDIFVNNINVLYVILGITIGALIGFLIGKIFTIEWHSKEKKVISRLDILGGTFFILYTLSSFFRHWLFGHWFSGINLSIFTLSFVEGVMIGRIFILQLNIKKVLLKQGKEE